MKILQVSPYFLPYFGGQERYVYYLSEYLSKMGQDVYVLASDYSSTSKKQRKIQVENFKVLKYHMNIRLLRNPISFSFRKELVKIIKKEKIDVINFHNDHAFSTLIGSAIKSKYPIPSIVTIHGILKFGSLIPDLIEKLYFKTASRYIFRKVDLIATNSSYEMLYLTKFFPFVKNKVLLRHNAIDTKYWLKLKEKPINIGKKMFTILFVGNLIKRKGIGDLIKGFNVLNKKHNNTKLIIVGEGDDKNFLLKLISKFNLSNKIKLLGNITDSELKFLYKNSDVLVLPSFSEGCSTTILEALFFRLPVVFSNIPSNTEFFSDFGYSFFVGDHKDLAKKLNYVINNYNEAKRKAKKGSKIVRKEYSWKHVAKLYLKTYEMIVSK